ncbi:MAG: hypothetical protein CM15mP21_2360 [Hyphomicrobiales bacterium]|nr:MAG: hypothetical protein CM15mP21_2360 [Hyphomicrobiales bacterium]
MQLVPFGCQEQKALAPVVNANFLINIALVDEFTQNRAKLCLVTAICSEDRNAQPGIAPTKCNTR